MFFCFSYACRWVRLAYESWNTCCFRLVSISVSTKSAYRNNMFQITCPVWWSWPVLAEKWATRKENMATSRRPLHKWNHETSIGCRDHQGWPAQIQFHSLMGMQCRSVLWLENQQQTNFMYGRAKGCNILRYRSETTGQSCNKGNNDGVWLVYLARVHAFTRTWRSVPPQCLNRN